ncbi:MAG: deoxyribose-phosphate aldolase [Wenzhouxiangella sp.]
MTAPAASSLAAAERILPLLDLTSLNEGETEADILALCRRACTPHGPVAAVCLWPRWVSLASRTLSMSPSGKTIKVATVVNFPHGATDVDWMCAEVDLALRDGADEIDLVFPYRALMAGDTQTGFEMVSLCRQRLEGQALKVILETGELAQPELIRQASGIAIEAGADFLKTSTGKVPVNATLDAARELLKAIKDSGASVGFKAAGGIRTTAEAAAYLSLADELLGPDWARPGCFRFGASSLLDDLLETLGGNTPATSAGPGY